MSAHLQVVLTDVIGNLFFRAGHLKPLRFILDGATEALRQHVQHYADMRARAAEQHPDLFVTLRDEALLERGRRRRGLHRPPAAAGTPAMPATTDVAPEADDAGEKSQLVQIYWLQSFVYSPGCP